MTLHPDALKALKSSLDHLVECIEKEQDLIKEDYSLFIQAPLLAFPLIESLQALDLTAYDSSFCSACLFALDICVTQLKSLKETGYPRTEKNIVQLMEKIALSMSTHKHPLHFWLPILNIFYDAHIDLLEDLKEAFLELAADEEQQVVSAEWSQLEAIRSLIAELSDASVFDITENFFAQSAAMPPEFFSDLVMDLYRIEEGHDIALLMLLHPQLAVREVVVATLDLILPTVTLSDLALSRLQAIQAWYPSTYQSQFERWIKHQRKKGVVFARPAPAKIIQLSASEIDGSGAQGVFIRVKHHRKTQLCGLLFKSQAGIKDAWVTVPLSSAEVEHYEQEAFDDDILLREVDIAYLQQITQHFLAVTIASHHVPDLHVLEIQELLGIQFMPVQLDPTVVLEELIVSITPFTPERLALAVKQSLRWAEKNQFIDSWYIENQQVDKWVNRYSSFIEGVKTCRAAEAMQAVFAEEMEPHRAAWLFHFVWVALWLKAGARKNATYWQDSLLIAYSLSQGLPLHEIPLMRMICEQSVKNSIETMEERRTYLN